MNDYLTKRIGEIAARATEIGGEIDEILSHDGLTEEQAGRFANLEAEAGQLAAEKTDLEKRAEARARVAKLAENPANLIPGGPSGPELTATRVSNDPYDLSEVRGYGAAAGKELRGRAFKAVETERSFDDRQKQHVTRMLERVDTRDGKLAAHILATGAPEYRDAWSKLMAGDNNLTDPERRAVSRAMSLTDSAGGYMIPFTLDPTIILTNVGIIDPIRPISRVESIVTDVWHGVTSAGVTASWDAEGAEVSDDTPTLVGPSITPAKGAAFIPFSIEAGMDIANLGPAVAELFADAKARLEGAAFATGTGSAQPKGVEYATHDVTASRVSATTNNSFGLVDVYKVYDALPARHRANASWIANGAILNDIRQFDTYGGGGLWERLAAGNPALLLGKPVYECSTMDGAIATGNDDILLVGDFRNYLIVDRVGMSVEYIPHLFGATNARPTGQRGWYAYWRVGADVLNADAFRVLRV